MRIFSQVFANINNLGKYQISIHLRRNKYSLSKLYYYDINKIETVNITGRNNKNSLKS
jgi:hypothetical protein